MEHDLKSNVISRSNMNEYYLSSSFHRKKPRLFFQSTALNQKRSFSSLIHTYQSLPKKLTYSSSYASLNSYLKEYNLSQSDLFELQQALRTIFHLIQSEIMYDHRQRLTSPYLQQKFNNNSNKSLQVPLYTNENFIRNGLLNHNDGPEIHDNHFPSIRSKSIRHLHTCSSSCYSSLSSMLTTPMNITLPLTLLSNKKYLNSALTNNFSLEKSKYSKRNIELNRDNNCSNETKSMIIRRNKVQAWERENNLQKQMSIEYSLQRYDQFKTSEHCRNSIIQTSSKSKNKITDKSNCSTLRICHKQQKKEHLPRTKDSDLFPMVKILGKIQVFRVFLR